MVKTSFGKNLSSNGSVLSPHKHGQDYLLVLDVMVIKGKIQLLMEKTQD